MTSSGYSARRDPDAPPEFGQPPVYDVTTPRGIYRVRAKDGAAAIEVAREMCERDLEMDRDLAEDEGDASAEAWLPVVGWEGLYSVSDLGRVRRDAPSASRFPPGLLRPGRTRFGYLHVQLCDRGRTATAKVHRLVALAFIGPAPSESHEVNHRDGVKANNALSNLEWCTRAENVRHARDIGLRPPLTGERHGRARLTIEQVREIRSSSEAAMDLARRFGVGKTTVGQIRRGVTWRSDV